MPAINVKQLTEQFHMGGGWAESGSFDLTPANIIAQSASQETVAIPEAQVGDLIFVNAEALPALALLQGAKVTSAGVVTLYFSNGYASTTLSFSKLHFEYICVHFNAA